MNAKLLCMIHRWWFLGGAIPRSTLFPPRMQTKSCTIFNSNSYAYTLIKMFLYDVGMHSPTTHEMQYPWMQSSEATIT